MAGEWARVKGTVFGLWPLFAGVFVAGYSAALALRYPVVGCALFVVAAVWCAVTLARGLRHVERYFKGARGEERVAGILQKLPDGYHVFNDFVACGRHVDHVVVGSGGVFAVETKFWLGRVTLEDGHILLDGQLTDRPPLRQVLKEAEAVRNELAKRGWRGEVTPVLAFASDTFEAKIAESGGVVIINSNALETSFASVRTVLPPAELDRLVRLMENG